jgi:hypothetical protein
MKFLRAVPALFCMAFLGGMFSPSSRADEYDKKTTVTFSMPVEIPGVHLQGWGVLPAGTYVFKLLNSDSNRHIVQIFNQDQTIIYATILAIPNYRLKPTDKTVITFNERLSGNPEALRAWFYPGANWGEEFVYPKEKAVELAQETKLPVLAVVAAVKVEVAKPDEPEVVTELKQAPVMAIKPTGEVVELAQVVQSPPSATLAATLEPAQATELPNTSSSLPLIALLGMLSLVCALSMRLIRRRAL